MKKSLIVIFCIAIFITHQFIYAKNKKELIIKNEKSKCYIKGNADEPPLYMTYKVYKGEKIIYAPKSDQIKGIIFSYDGKYIAIGSTDIPSTDIDKESYFLVIVNCENEKIKGFINYKSLNYTNGEVKFSDKVYSMPKDWSAHFIPFEWGDKNELVRFKYCDKQCMSIDKQGVFVFDEKDPLP